MKCRRWFTLMVCVLGASFAAAQNIESAAKLAYARLSFATQVGVVEEAVRANPSITYDELMKIVAEKSVTFDIHILSSGAVSKVANVPYSSLASKPIGEDVILTGPIEARYQTEASPEKRSFSAMPPQWKPGQTVLEDWTPSLGEMLKISDAEQKRTPEQRATQYVSMKVTATLATRSLTHNVMALFAKDGTFLIVDPVTNQSALDFFATHSPFPGTLLETDLRTSVVQRWLSEHAVSAKANKGDVLCNLKALTCGVATGDLKSIPTAQSHMKSGTVKKPGYVSCSSYDFEGGPNFDPVDDNTDHVTGRHHYIGNTSYQCLFSGNCCGLCWTDSHAYASSTMTEDANSVYSGGHLKCHEDGNYGFNGLTPV